MKAREARGGWLRVAAGIAILTVWAACGESGPPVPESPSAECQVDAETVEVWGPWKVDVTGQNEGCENERWNREFVMRPSLEFEVSQRADSGTPGVERLRLARSVDGYRFEGSVQGNCVKFSIAGERAEGSAMAFSGTVGEGEIEGSFLGNGPGTCRASGSFQARFRQSALRR